MSGQIKTNNLPVALPADGVKVLGLDKQGQTVQLPFVDAASKTELANLRADCGEKADKSSTVSSSASEEQDLIMSDANGYVPLRTRQGHVETKRFNSANTPQSCASDNYILCFTDYSGNIGFGVDGNGNLRYTGIRHNGDYVGSPSVYVPSDLNTTGLAVFDTVDSLYSAFDALVESHPQFFKRETDLGYDQSGQYTMRYYTLRFQNPSVNADRQATEPNQWDDTTYKYRRLLVNLSVHANEKNSTLAGYLFIKEILESNEQWAVYIRSNFVLDIVPCCNPWGLNNNSNYNSRGINLNREYGADNPEQEVANMKTLIQSLKQKGLVGIIDLHNSGVGEGYFVCKKSYRYYNYYCVLTQKIHAILQSQLDAVFGTAKTNHFHTWTYESEEESVGQLHWYADQNKLLGCTLEVANNKGLIGSVLEKAIAINVINAFFNF